MESKPTHKDTVLLVVDLQEKFRPAINDFQEISGNAVKLIRGFKILGLPVLLTEQYPEGLGGSVGEVREACGCPAIEKTCFSCLKSPEVKQELDKINAGHLILCGIEAHVCIIQTALEAKKQGYKVSLVLDAVGSRKTVDKEAAVSRAMQAGVYPETVEMVLFRLLKDANANEFREISKLVK